MDDYRLDLSTRSLLGSRTRLQDVPKIAQIVEARLHAWFDERCVEPRFQQIVLPSLWPRKKNTRGGEEDLMNNYDDGQPVNSNLQHDIQMKRSEQVSMPDEDKLRRRMRRQDNDQYIPGAMPGFTMG